MLWCNGLKVENGTFPNKEQYFDMQVVKSSEFSLTWKYEDDTSIISLIMFSKELRRMFPQVPQRLNIAYMPYSRMDRSEYGRCFSLKYIAELINSLGFIKVYILEPHSDVTCALVNNSSKVSVVERLFDYAKRADYIKFNYQEDLLFFPDAGAQKNFSKMYAANVGVGLKERDFVTGRIKNYTVNLPSGYDLKGKRVIIVDDLCSRGGTFIMAAEMLLEYNPLEISLVTAHTESTIIDGDILKTHYISNVITTDSIINKSWNGYSPKLKIVGFDYYIPEE